LPPANGNLTINFSGIDGQLGGGFFPNGVSDLTYAFNNGTVNITSSNPSYYPFVSENYNTSTGEIQSSTPPVLADPGTDSFINYYPSDWAQRLAKELGTKNVGDTATLSVTVEGRGRLPNLVANTVFGEPVDSANLLQMATTVTATRLPNGTVNGVANACKFSYTMYRPFMAPIAVLRTGTPEITPDEATMQAVIAAFITDGPAGGIMNTMPSDYKKLFEFYLPAMEGTFATSNTIPFFPVSLEVNHIFGISSLANPTYNLKAEDGTEYPGLKKDVAPSAPAAQQIFTYQP